MGVHLNLDGGTLLLDGGTLTLDGGTHPPYNLSTDCSYSYSFKNVRNMIEMASKLRFLLQNNKIRPSAGGSVPQILFVIRLSCISLFSTGPKLYNFCAKEINFWFKPLPLSKIVVALLVAFTAADVDFSIDYINGRHTITNFLLQEIQPIG